MKIRCNTIPVTNVLVRQRLIANTYKDKCIMCDEAPKENVYHMLITCKAYSRDNSLWSKIKSRLPTLEGRGIKELARSMLGSEIDTDENFKNILLKEGIRLAKEISIKMRIRIDELNLNKMPDHQEVPGMPNPG